jgi:hypothetical protein
MRNLKPGAVTGALEYGGDIEGFINKILRPALAKANITDPAMVNAEISKLFPESTAARLAQIYYQQQPNIEKDRGNIAGAMPLGDAYKEMMDHDPKAVMAAFNQQFKAMLEAIGGPLMQTAIPAMKSITEVFTSVGAFANANPQAVKLVGEAFVILAGGLIAIGAVSLATLVGVPALIAGAVTAVWLLAAYNWEAIKSGVTIVEQRHRSNFAVTQCGC